MEIEKLVAEPRTALGTRSSRKLRAEGRLPAVIYGHGEKPESVSVLRHDLEVALLHGARTLEVELNGTTNPYLIKDVQYDHLDHLPIHVDLTRVDLHERVTVRIAVEPRGTPKGVSEGGILDLVLPEIEVECLVTEIPGTLHPLVVELDIDDVLTVKDLELPPGVVAVTDPEDRVAVVRRLAVAEEVEEPEEPEAEDVEPERIGRVRKEEEEGAG